MKNIKPAIVAVGYNRPDCMKRLITGINEAYYPYDDVTLIVSIDESDRSNEVEEAARNVGWNHGEMIIRRFEQRQGLRNHILQCGDLSEKYDAVIILEDDLMVSRSYYSYVLQCLDQYGEDERIAGISLYSHAWNGYANVEFQPVNNGYDAYFGQFSITWGECWTKQQWNGFRTWYAQHQDKLTAYTKLPKDIEYWGDKSWGKYFAYYIVEMNLFYIIPYVSLSTNYSEVGEHNLDSDSIHQVALLETDNKRYELPSFDTALKYDMFFERIFEAKDSICGISGDQICVNLNGTHRDNDGKRYLLSSVKMSRYECIKSFGLSLRPIELNVVKGIPGNDIYLYDLKGETVRLSRVRIPSYNRIAYELYGNGMVRINAFTALSFVNKLKKTGKTIVEKYEKTFKK